MSHCPNCGCPVHELRVDFMFADGVVTVDGKKCALRPSQMDILETLADVFPSALDLRELHDRLYAGRDDAPYENTTLQNIYDMRQRFQAAGINLQLVYMTGIANQRNNRAGRYLLTHCTDKQAA